MLCKLTGKAQEACSSLSRDDFLAYEKIKSAVLQAYELLSEAYRQHFQGLELPQGQSYLDFAITFLIGGALQARVMIWGRYVSLCW